jgi:putative transposase
MPRKPRFFRPGVPVHVVQRGNNRQPIFFDGADYRAYLGWLKDASARWSCPIHAYVLMTNHVHLLLTPPDSDGISRTMQYLGRCYVPYINETYQRSGTLWEGRFKSSLVQTEAYLLACYTYIELNPVRAGMVAHPRDYRWSSYAHNACGETDPLISEHPEFLRLATTQTARQTAYRALFTQEPGVDTLKDIRSCLQTGTPLGNDRFRKHIEATLGTSVGKATRGRPRTPLDTPREGTAARSQRRLDGF